MDATQDHASIANHVKVKMKRPCLERCPLGPIRDQRLNDSNNGRHNGSVHSYFNTMALLSASSRPRCCRRRRRRHHHHHHHHHHDHDHHDRDDDHFNIIILRYRQTCMYILGFVSMFKQSRPMNVTNIELGTRPMSHSECDQ